MQEEHAIYLKISLQGVIYLCQARKDMRTLLWTAQRKPLSDCSCSKNRQTNIQANKEVSRVFMEWDEKYEKNVYG